MPRSRPSLTLLVLIGCTTRAPPPERSIIAADVLVEPRSLTLRAGDTAQLAAQVNDAVGQPIGGAPLSFETSDPGVVRVTPTGLAVSAGSAGAGRIVVSSGGTKTIVPVVVTPGSASRVVKSGGDGQRGAVGLRLEAPVSVKSVDAYGNPVPDAKVRFFALDGGGVTPPVAVSDGAGVASATWTLGRSPGVQRLTAGIDEDRGATELFTATAQPGAAAKLLRVETPGSPAVAGSEAVFRVRVTDAHGNAIPGAEIAWRRLSGAVSVSAAASPADADGVAEVRVKTGARAGANEVEARAAGLAEPLVMSLTTVAGAPARVEVVSGDRQVAAPGRAVRTSPAVRVVDANGNPVDGRAVRFEVTGGGGAVERAEAITDGKGLASCGRWTLGAPGRNELSAVAAGVGEPAKLSASARRR